MKPSEFEVLYADGFDEALIDLGYRFHGIVAIYDYNECVRILMKRDKMSEEEAVEFMEFNVLGSYVGESTPVFLFK